MVDATAVISRETHASLGIWVFPKIGLPMGTPKWMVKIFASKPYEQMDDWGIPLFLEGHPYHTGFLPSTDPSFLLNFSSQQLERKHMDRNAQVGHTATNFKFTASEFEARWNISG